MEAILEFFVNLLGDLIFDNLLLPIFKLAQTIGLIITKLVTFSNLSIKELREKYNDSSKPYFLGFGLIGGIIYWLCS